MGLSMAWLTPIAIHSANKLDPPELMNGSGMPIAAIRPFAIIMFTHVWIPIQEAIPTSTSFGN